MDPCPFAADIPQDLLESLAAPPSPEVPPAKSRRGFAGMDKERQRQIARLGGQLAHAQGNAHQFNSEQARAAGQKGGQRVSENRDHMSTIGRQGGLKRWRKTIDG